MNASQRLFDRFEKAGPSWLPIIVLSLAGLSATLFCVQAMSGLADRELPDRLRGIYLDSREMGQLETMLYAISRVDEGTLTDQERQRVQAAQSAFPDLTFLEALNANPAFPRDPNQSPSRFPRDDPRMYCWSDESGEFVLLGRFDWQDPANDLETAATGAGSLSLFEAICFSRPAAPGADFVSTIAIKGEVALSQNDQVLDVDLSQSGAMARLIDSHRERTRDTALETFDAEGMEVVVQDFLNQRAFAFANRGGLTIQEKFASLIVGIGGLPEEIRHALVAAVVLGHRNGLSQQFDQYVIERLSRDADIDGSNDGSDDGSSIAARIVIHPLSCPIRTHALLDGVDPRDVTSTEIDGNTIAVATVDYPSDLVEQIEAYAAKDTNPREIAAALDAEVRRRQDWQAIFQIDEPFSATIYQVEPPK